MDKRLQTLGILFIVYGAMGLTAASIVFLVFAGAGVISGLFSDIFAMTFITSRVGLIWTAVVAISAIPALLSGWAILKHNSWGRTTGLIFGALLLFEAPFGTALGIYALRTLRNEDAVKLFKSAKLQTA
ncbi:MAG: hypothetical protein GY839_06795 [candidate division Zixibacteria bacterium]|nr:hypothetical protein [candidate division Zixibacteria bacterium]